VVRFVKALITVFYHVL